MTAPNRRRVKKNSNDPGDIPGERQRKRKRGASVSVAPPPTNEKTPEELHTPPSTPSAPPRGTPHRYSSSHPHSVPVQLSRSSQNKATKETLSPSSADEAKKYRQSLSRPGYNKDEMEYLLRREVDGAVYEYPQLCEEFFDVDKHRVDNILARLEAYPLLRRHNQWLIDFTSLTEGDKTNEKHITWAKLLDIIMHEAFEPHQFRATVQEIMPGKEVRLVGDHPDDVSTAPDIVQGVQVKERRHWGDLEFFAECKKDEGQLGEALMQIARYSRALFTHQIYRKHIFSLAFCGTSATFVRVTRSGLIHSNPIDINIDPEKFIRAAAGLFALDDAKFGYNTLFYYWPPLSEEANKSDRELRFVTSWEDSNMCMRWTVAEVLCHRMCLVGRATVVVLLRRIGNPQHHAVLKLIWRPSTRIDENEALKEFDRCPGICRRRWGIWTEDTAVRCPESLQPSRYQYVFLDISPEERQEIHEALSMDTPDSTSHQYRAKLGATKIAKERNYSDSDSRTYSMILMDEGVKLWRIKHLVHLLRVLRDGIIGYTHVIMKKRVHRDISEGNILCGPRNAAELDAFWEGNPVDFDSGNMGEISPNDTSGRYEFDDLSFLAPEEDIDKDASFSDYISKRYAKQQPFGRLYDFEFMVPENRGDNEVRSVADRTGTFAFMPLGILRANEAYPIQHHFLHDIESFFWVFLWLIFVRAKTLGRLRPHHGKEFNKLFIQDDPEDAKDVKLTRTVALGQLVEELVGRDPAWQRAEQFAKSFAGFVTQHLYPLKEPQPQLPLGISEEERWKLIRELIDEFDKEIQTLQNQHAGGQELSV